MSMNMHSLCSKYTKENNDFEITINSWLSECESKKRENRVTKLNYNYVKKFNELLISMSTVKKAFLLHIDVSYEMLNDYNEESPESKQIKTIIRYAENIIKTLDKSIYIITQIKNNIKIFSISSTKLVKCFDRALEMHQNKATYLIDTVLKGSIKATPLSSFNDVLNKSGSSLIAYVEELNTDFQDLEVGIFKDVAKQIKHDADEYSLDYVNELNKLVEVERTKRLTKSLSDDKMDNLRQQFAYKLDTLVNNLTVIFQTDNENSLMGKGTYNKLCKKKAVIGDNCYLVLVVPTAYSKYTGRPHFIINEQGDTSPYISNARVANEAEAAVMLNVYLEKDSGALHHILKI